MKTRTRYATAALLATLLLTSCGSETGGPSTTTTPSADGVDAPRAEQPAPSAGTVVTEDEAADLPEGLRAYEMADGSLVVLDDSAALPETVRAEMTAPIIALAAAAAGSASAGEAAQAELERLIGDELETAQMYGRNFTVVLPVDGADGRTWTVLAQGRNVMVSGETVQDKAVALAEDDAFARNAAGETFTEVVVL